MAVDLDAWRAAIVRAARGIADEGMQRRAWLGSGPEISSPEEVINQFLGDAAIEGFLARSDTGLSDLQIESGKHLVKSLRELLKQLREPIDAASLIDDPRWKRVRDAATQFVTHCHATEGK